MVFKGNDNIRIHWDITGPQKTPPPRRTGRTRRKTKI